MRVHEYEGDEQREELQVREDQHRRAAVELHAAVGRRGVARSELVLHEAAHDVAVP